MSMPVEKCGNDRANPPDLRRQISLNGEWELGGKVPDYTGGDFAEKTYLRHVAVPSAWRGKRIKLHFQAVNYAAEAFIDECPAGTHVGPWIPWEIDITELVEPGRSFVLTVKVKGMENDPIVDEEGNARWPVGSSFIRNRHGGLVDDVWLRAFGTVHVEDAFVRTSFRQKRLIVEYALCNSDSRRRTVAIMASAAPVGGTDADGVRFREPAVTLEAGERKTVRLETTWEDPLLWWPDNPQLYHLTTRLVEMQAEGMAGRHPEAQEQCPDIMDEEVRRFGFREIWCEDGGFRLNGVRVHFWGDYAEYGNDAYWPAEAYRPDALMSAYAALQRMNVRIMRWHEHPVPQYVLDAADECGMLLVCESAVEHLKRIDKPAYLRNAPVWLEAWVKVCRNHPSIVMWSADNAMGPFCFNVLTAKELLPLGAAIRAADPTRPVVFDGERDLGDEIVNYHDIMLKPEESIYQWRRYVHPAKPTGASEAIPALKYWYRNNPEMREINKWRQGVWIRGMRYAGFADIRPSVYWACGEAESLRASLLRNAYAPVALFDKDYDDLGIDPYLQGAYPELQEGEEARRTLVLYNDDYRGEPVEIEVEVRVRERVYASVRKRFRIEMGGKLEIPCRFVVPPAGETPLELVLRTFKEGRSTFTETKSFRVLPALSEEGAATKPPASIDIGTGSEV